MNIKFSPCESHQKGELIKLVRALYEEDPGGEIMNSEKIDKTLRFLSANPGNGQVLVFELDGIIVGYAILINFWSNEYGGLLLHIDELYVKREFRNRKIGTAFLNYLMRNPKNEYKGIFLEVLASNHKARSFYTRNGFSTHENEILKYLFA